MPKFYSASQFTLLYHPLSHLIFTTTEKKEEGIGTHILKARPEDSRRVAVFLHLFFLLSKQ